MVKKKKEKQSSKRNTALLAIIIAFITVSSILGYTMRDESNVVRYNNIQFTQSDNFWTANVFGNKLYFYNSPENFGSINISDDAINAIINSRMFYMVFDPDEEDAYLSAIDAVSSDFYNSFSSIPIFVQRATTSENKAYALPIADCKNATAYVPVIDFKSSNQTRVYLQGSCIIADSENALDILRIRDKLLFVVFYEIGKQR